MARQIQLPELQNTPGQTKELNIAVQAYILDRRNRRHLRTHHKILAFTDSLRKRSITKAIKQHSIDDDEHDTSTDADMIDTGRLELIEGLAYQYDKTEGSANKGHNGEDPRTAFHRDLLQTLRAYQDTGADLLVVGDFNEAFGSDSEGMSGIASSLQHVNLMSTRHSSRPPPTYARGSACLDYALASPKVSIALRKAGYDAFDARLPSDHRGYYLDFQTDLLFGNQTQALANPQQRLLHASNIQQVTTYLNEKYELLMAHNAFDRGARLTYQGNRHKFAERLDRVVTEASLVTESRIPQFDDPVWSVKLSQAKKQVQWLRKLL